MNPLIGTELLKMLGSGIRTLAGGGQRDEPVESAGFDQLLDRAQQGDIESGRLVTIAAGTGIELDDEQIRLISEAADRLEARGATRAAVMLGGSAYEIDVATRTVLGEIDPASNQPLVGLDAVARADAGPADAPLSAAEALRAIGGAFSPSLARALRPD